MIENLIIFILTKSYSKLHHLTKLYIPELLHYFLFIIVNIIKVTQNECDLKGIQIGNILITN